MIYRKLGRTKYEVSEIGIGCEGFIGKSREEVKAFIDLMEEAGANCIDLYSPNEEMRKNLGYALQGRRDKFILQAHLCTAWKNGQYERTRDIDETKASFEEQLRLLQTDHVEIAMIHYVDAMSDWESIVNGPIMAYAKELLASGTAGCIGISSHNPEVVLAAAESGLADVIMFSVNPCYDLLPASEDVDMLFEESTYDRTFFNMEPTRQALYETCQRLGVAITVMKAFGGGDLLKGDVSPAKKSLTLHQCLHYALTRPAVAVVMSGARTPEEFRENLAYETASDGEKDYAEAFSSLPKISWSGHCMYCGHCAPCPMGISIADVTKFLNLAKAQGDVPETVREHYAVLPHTASECIACGQCEERCPFDVSIIENMQQASELFGK